MAAAGDIVLYHGVRIDALQRTHWDEVPSGAPIERDNKPPKGDTPHERR